MIRLKNLRKIYNKSKPTQVVALDNIDLNIQEGEYLAIMGVSGSGKTTLLNIIGCLDKFDEGSYYYHNEDISAINSNKVAELRNKAFGCVLQDFGLILERNVYDNAAVPLYFNRDVKFNDISDKVDKVLNYLGISKLKKTKARELSAGQKQRVAIARALVNEPKVILADEPTASLDAKTAAEIMDIFDGLNKDGITIIIVTHDNKIAQRTKRIIYLDDGKLKII